MNTFTATLFIETNPLSRERLACGLLAVTPREVFFDWALPKVKVAEHLADKVYKGYFQERFRTIEKALREEADKRGKTTNGLFDGLLGQWHFERLERYNAGPVQFGDIKPYADRIDQELFMHLFRETIQHPATPKQRYGSGLRGMVNKKLDRPVLRTKADVDYELPGASIPGLLFGSKVSLATVNGSIQTMQVVDFRASAQTVEKYLNEAEVLYYQLLKLGSKLNIPVEKVGIIHGKAGQEAESNLVEAVRSEKNDVFRTVPVDELDARLDAIEQGANYRPLSEVLAG